MLQNNFFADYTGASLSGIIIRIFTLIISESFPTSYLITFLDANATLDPVSQSVSQSITKKASNWKKSNMFNLAQQHGTLEQQTTFGQYSHLIVIRPCSLSNPRSLACRAQTSFLFTRQTIRSVGLVQHIFLFQFISHFR